MPDLTKSVKVLLLNPPGTKMYFRDYYCAKVSKAAYYYHPIDFVYLSAFLKDLAQLNLIDAIASKISAPDCQKMVMAWKPDYIIFLSSGPSYREDVFFLGALKDALPETSFVGVGDVFREWGTLSFEKMNWLDAIINDFSLPSIVDYVYGSTEPLPGMLTRNNIEVDTASAMDEIHLPVPAWDFFDLDSYIFPFARHKSFASLMTDFGCPHSCSFCPVGGLTFRKRTISSVISELKYLNQIGVKELYVRDQTFGVDASRTKEMLNAWITENFSFSWTCQTRVDVLNAELLQVMKKAGCHTIMLGIESANAEMLKSQAKNIKPEQAEDMVKIIQSQGIRVSGYFMIGFPGENMQSIKETVQLACSLKLDFASFNIVSPRYGSQLRKKALKNDLLQSENSDYTDSSFTVADWKNAVIKPADLYKLKRKATRCFYLRPSYLFKRLFSLRTGYEFVRLFHEARHLLKKNSAPLDM